MEIEEKRITMLRALANRAKAERDTALVQLNNYIQNPVGVGEHPNIVEEAEKQLEIYAHAEEKLTTLKKLFNLEV